MIITHWVGNYHYLQVVTNIGFSDRHLRFSCLSGLSLLVGLKKKLAWWTVILVAGYSISTSHVFSSCFMSHQRYLAVYLLVKCPWISSEVSLPPLKNGDKIRQLRQKLGELERLEKARTSQCWGGVVWNNPWLILVEIYWLIRWDFY